MAHVRNRMRTLPRYESCDRTRGRTACTELTCTTVPGRYGTVSPVKDFRLLEQGEVMYESSDEEEDDDDFRDQE